MPTQRDFSALQELSIGGNLVRGFLEAYDCRDFLRFTTVGGGVLIAGFLNCRQDS
jgi:hypothetical protein